MGKCVGIIEFKSVSKGIEASNEMVKLSNVEIIMLKSTCIGKFVTIVTGEETEVQGAIDNGADLAGKFLLDYYVISSISESIIDALKNKYVKKEITDAMAIMETRNICKGLKALDETLKSGDCTLVQLQVAFTLGGKLIYIVTGPVSSLQSGIDSAVDALEENEVVNASVVASPSPDLIKSLLKS